ncbi:hypothetical protein MTO96_038972 [Rhipicephalus appendiculatus]
MDTVASSSKRTPSLVDESTIPVDEGPPPYPGPPSTVPDSFFSVVGDIMFVGAGTRLPLGSSGVACGPRHHREGSPVPALKMVLFFWVTLVVVGILFSIGVAITGMAYVKCVDSPQIRQGMLCVLGGRHCRHVRGGLRRHPHVHVRRLTFRVIDWIG